MDSAGKVRFVTRSGTCVVVRIIGRRFGLVDGYPRLDRVVVISRRRVACAFTSCVCRKYLGVSVNVEQYPR